MNSSQHPATKEIATTFLRLCATGSVREAYDRYVAPGFRHHNPYFPGDADSLAKGMEEAAAKFPRTAIETQRALEDGDLVAVHSKVTHEPGGRAVAVVHIFRFEGERIAEFWDVGMEGPASSPNAHGMF